MNRVIIWLNYVYPVGMGAWLTLTVLLFMGKIEASVAKAGIQIFVTVGMIASGVVWLIKRYQPKRSAPGEGV